jgi:hypothetical protein
VSRGPLPPAMGPGMDPGAIEPGGWQGPEPWAGPWQGSPGMPSDEGAVPDGGRFER